MTFTDHLDAVRDGAQRAGRLVVGEPASAVRLAVVGLLALRRVLDGALIGALAHFQRLGAFRAEGAFDAAAFLRSCGVSGRAAKELGRALASADAFPAVAAALADATLSVEHAALLFPMIDHVGADRATLASIDELVRAAARESPDEFRHRVAHADLVAQQCGGKERQARQRDNSRLQTSDRPDGMKGIDITLDPERHAIVCNALDALVDEHWRTGSQATERPATHELPKLRVDALVDMAQRTLTGTGTAVATDVGGDVAGDTATAGPSSSRRGEPQVVVLVDYETLRTGIDRLGGTCVLDDGTPIPGETARRIACDAAIIPVVLGAKSEVLDVGRRSRLATAAQRVALRARSATCEFPGCTVPARYSRAHHLDIWEHGGRTDLERLAWLCSHHHHAVHEGGWAIERLDGRTIVHRPDGTTFSHAPPSHAPPANEVAA